MLFKNYIDGKWCEGSQGKKDVINPADGQVIGQRSMCGADDVDKAVKAAKRAQSELESLSVFERGDMLFRISDAILARREELAALLSREHGKIY